jgi:hypothetical protein
MQEVTIAIRFNRVCLGAAKKKKHGQTLFCFDRDPVGRVMFMPSSWLSCMRYAAKIANLHHALVKKIDWCPVVIGKPRNDWRRTIVTKQNTDGQKSHYALHEAFKPGDVISVSAVLPAGISLEDFDRLLTLVGKYRGFSPFNNIQEKYGTFEVISIEPTTGYIDPKNDNDVSTTSAD